MNQTIFLSITHLIGIICSIGTLSIQSQNLADLQTIKTTIVKTLHTDPEAIDTFRNFFTRYDTLVESFFDTRNNNSLAQHVRHMENELTLLQDVCNQTRFACVRNHLTTYCAQVGQLVGILKKYIGSHDTLSLALKVRQFDFLLPENVKKQGKWSLFWALKHRLHCNQI